MDSRPKLYSLVQLSMVLVRQLQQVYGNTLQSPLDKDGVFIVIGIHHSGDTRGNEWYTELTCVSRDLFTNSGGLPYLLAK